MRRALNVLILQQCVFFILLFVVIFRSNKNFFILNFEGSFWLKIRSNWYFWRLNKIKEK